MRLDSLLSLASQAWLTWVQKMHVPREGEDPPSRLCQVETVLLHDLEAEEGGRGAGEYLAPVRGHGPPPRGVGALALIWVWLVGGLVGHACITR